MSDLNWTGKSQKMFDTMLGEVPEAMRPVFKEKLTGIILQKSGGGPVSEDNVTSVVNEIVPEPFKSNILKRFKQLGDFDLKVVEDIITKHGTTQDALMFILHDIQDEIGYLPVESLQIVSSVCDIKMSTIYNVVTFYKTFRLTPKGSTHIKVCRGTACSVKDRDSVADYITDKTRSSSVSVEKTLCMGCCDCGPAIEIDGKVYTGNDAKLKVDALVQK